MEFGKLTFSPSLNPPDIGLLYKIRLVPEISTHQELGILYPAPNTMNRRALRTAEQLADLRGKSTAYLEDLLAENERLRRNVRVRQSETGVEIHNVPQSAGREGEPTDGPIRNPLFDDRPWFHTTPGAPILIGEAADAAFATRLCQALSNESFVHIQRTSFPADNTLLALAGPICPFPTPGRARFLLKAALKNVSRGYHIVLKSASHVALEKLIHQPSTADILLSSKIWALLALGELYTARSGKPESQFPGLSYFAQASRALHVIQERPSLDSIEVLLLLSVYNINCNRRHSAYCLAGSAVRQAVIMGLQLNVPESQLGDKVLREHRNRIWWTAYELDTLIAARQSQPASIQEEDILVDLPSNANLPPDGHDDFVDAAELVDRIKLVRLTGQITKLLYRRKTQKDSFLQRVQKALKDLQDWFQGLGDNLQSDEQHLSRAVSGPMRSLLLSFNQCMIVATRPVALYVLRAHRETWSMPNPAPKPNIPANVQTLTDACIRCARHSFSLLVDSWVDGSFLTFDYSPTLYLFSAATILSLSSLLQGQGSSKDRDDFELALQLTTELNQNGNCAAVEFERHLQAMKGCMKVFEESTQVSTHTDGIDSSGMVSQAPGSMGLDYALGTTTYNTGTFTAGMALAEPSMQAFLSQSDPNFQHMDISILQNDFDGFYWPEC
ncbi:hypothetical protein JX266_010187 [Neoarthrinium moseri]|nr:hypothetical protein JX266_010187 [Neoarthrinium moseri]